MSSAPFRYRLLVVSAAPSSIEMIASMLAEEPFEVQQATSINAALDILNPDPPHLILTDLSEADEVGWQFCHLLSSEALARFGLIPVVAFSHQHDREQVETVVHALNTRGHFTLPIEPATLAALLQSCLRRAGSATVARVGLLTKDPLRTSALSHRFTAIGCAAEHLPEIADAQDRILAARCDILVAELSCPEVLPAIRAWTQLAPRLTVVTLSTDLDPHQAIPALQHGASDHVPSDRPPHSIVEVCMFRRRERSWFELRCMLARRTEDLHETQTRLRVVLDATPHAMVLLDQSGRPEIWNDAATQMTSTFWQKEISSAIPVADYLPASHAARGREIIAGLFAGQDFAEEISLPCHDGSIIWLAISGVPVPASDHRVAWVCLTIRDVTETHADHAALQWQSRALDSVSQGILIADPSFRIRYANDYFTTLTGYHPDEILGRTCAFLQGPASSEKTRREIRQGLAAGQPVNCEILNYRKDKSAFWNELRLSPIRDPDTGEIIQFVGTQSDVTTRKAAELELTASRGRLQAIFDHSLDAILLVDDQSRVVDANRAALDLFDFDLATFKRQKIFDLFRFDTNRSGPEAWERFRRDERRHGETTIRRLDGSTVEVEFEAVANIQTGLHLSILRDITERKALQSHMLRQQRLESVGRLASGVAHDLNNIFTPILMVPAMLRSQLTDTHSRALLTTIEQGARRGATIVRQLLDFSRANPGEIGQVDLQTITRAAIDIFRDSLNQPGTINATAYAGELPIRGNAGQLQQAIVHLILNAYESSAAKRSEVTVECDEHTVTHEDLARYPNAKHGPYVRVRVHDRGTGIASPIEEKIFEPFYTTKGFGNGRGLGLSVVLGIVNSHGGFIDIRSKPGVGTTATIWLPREHRGTVLTANEFEPARPGHNRLIMLIDDDTNLRSVTRATLLAYGFRVVCASEAEASLAQLKPIAQDVALVLVDLIMPGVVGNQLVEQIRHRHPTVPMLVMTGSIVPRPQAAQLQTFNATVLDKPFTGPKLLTAVERELSRTTPNFAVS